MNTTRKLLPLSIAAVRLGIHVTTLRGWVREGRVPAYRVGQRFTRVDWHELLAAIAVSHGNEYQPAGSDDASRRARGGEEVTP